jgi:hypothetical protein
VVTILASSDDFLDRDGDLQYALRQPFLGLPELEKLVSRRPGCLAPVIVTSSNTFYRRSRVCYERPESVW